MENGSYKKLYNKLFIPLFLNLPMKRGQVTIFIIIAVVIIVGVSLFFIFGNTGIKESLGLVSQEQIFLSQQSDIVSARFDQCLSESFISASYINAFNSGYFSPTENQQYYFIDNSVNYPSKEELENQISLGIKDFLPSCLDFSGLQSTVNYDLQEANIKTILYENYSEVTLGVPVSISINDSSTQLELFSTKVITDYLQFYNLAVELSDEQANHPDEVCITCIGDLSGSNEIFVEVDESEDDTTYALLYRLSRYDNQNQTRIIYSFIHKFKFLDE